MIPSGLGIFPSQNTKYSKNDMKLQIHWENSFFDIQSNKKFLWVKENYVNSKNILWSKEIDLFTLKIIFLNQQNFL